MASTCEPGSLIVASAYPDPPFDIVRDGTPTGFDLELMHAICAQLKRTMQPVRYPGSDFNGIFAGLEQGIYDAVISWLVRDRPQLAVALQVPTHEDLGIAVAKSNQPLCDSINEALDVLKGEGTFATLMARWFPNQTTRSSS